MPGGMFEIGVDGWGKRAKRCVWSLCVMIDPPVFDDLSDLGEIAKDVFIQAFISQSDVEAFHKCVLHRFARCDVVPANAGVLGHFDKRRSQRRMDVMSMKPRKLSAVLS